MYMDEVVKERIMVNTFGTASMSIVVVHLAVQP